MKRQLKCAGSEGGSGGPPITKSCYIDFGFKMVEIHSSEYSLPTRMSQISKQFRDLNIFQRDHIEFFSEELNVISPKNHADGFAVERSLSEILTPLPLG